MEELKKELEKLSKAYVDTPENEEKILIPFIKRLLELPMKDRRKLLPLIRELQWIKGRFAGFSSETTCSAARAHFLSAVQFVCANRREMDMAYHVKFDMLCKLLPLYNPTWMTDFINDDKTWFNFDLNYEELMQLMDMGYLKEIAPSRIAHVLPWITRIRNKNPKGDDTFNSELLLKRDITLKEHIWTLFEHESIIGYQDDCAKNAYKKGITTRDESISAALYRFSLDGHLDREQLLRATLATFLLEYQRLWAQTDNSNTGVLRNMFTRLEEKLKGIDKNRGAYDERSFKRLANWKPGYSNATCFTPIQQLWLNVIRQIKGGNSLPLLSTPTHTPAYLQATKLIRRLAAYQEAGKKPCSWDFQLAIARCALEDKEEAIVTARQLLQDEYLHLCLFLLDENTQPEPPYNHPTAWIAAGLVKAPETEFEAFKSFSCNTLPHNHLTGDYEWKEVKPKENSYETDRRLLQLDFHKWHKYIERNSHQLWQEHLIINSKYNMDDSRYMEPLLCCYPNRPEPLIAQIISNYMAFGSPQEDSKRTLACALRMLLSFHCPLKEMSLLLLSGSLLFVDKTVRSYAAELWVEGLSTGRINNHRVGEILARLINMELAPLKRFTTQVYESMYKRSAFHNRQLEELLTVFISGLPDKPVTGLKQLLELYLELLTINRSKVTNEQLLQRLQEWATNSNLKKVTTSLNKL